MATELELVVDFVNMLREKGICWACKEKLKCENRISNTSACADFVRIDALRLRR